MNDVCEYFNCILRRCVVLFVPMPDITLISVFHLCLICILLLDPWSLILDPWSLILRSSIFELWSWLRHFETCISTHYLISFKYAKWCLFKISLMFISRCSLDDGRSKNYSIADFWWETKSRNVSRSVEHFYWHCI